MSDDIESRFPQVAGKPMAMAMLAEVLLAKGRADDAFALALAAAELASDDMRVLDRLRLGLAAGISPWHVRMLNDERRNRCYAEALERAIRPGMQVLEIGTGAGLLAMVAARAGARVYTCEANPVVAAAASRIVARNGFADRITVIAKSSKDLRIGEDLPGPSDLLVSELFDDTLFGENIVAILKDAKRLLRPEAPVLPRFAELRCALVEQPLGPFHQPLGSILGFDLAPFNLLAPARTLRVRAKTATIRSAPVPALAMDFEASPFGPTQETVLLRSAGGRVDGFAQWIRIDFGGGIVLENNPFDDSSSHWAAPLYPFPHPVETAAGEPVEMNAQRLGDRLTLSLQG